MKKKLVILYFLLCGLFSLHAQVADNMYVIDTRSTNDPPTSFNHEVRFHFKQSSVVGLPSPGYYSGVMTVAPWGDNSGNKHHQIGFSESGLFWRTGFPESLSWDAWIKIVTADVNGAIQSSNAGLKIGPSNTSVQSDGFSLYLNAGGNTYLNTSNNAYITNSGGASFSGNVGIGTTNPNQKLTVNGTIYGKEVKVDLQVPGPDYVFEPTYQLPSLAEIENYIKANKHLPEVPSAKEMEANGINLSEMNMLLLKKVEELTLHQIEANKKIELLQNQVLELLQNQNKK